MVQPVDQRRPADRYGRQRRSVSPRTWLLITAVFAGAVVAFAAWAAIANADPVTYRDVSYRVEGPSSTVAVFDVSMEPGTTAVCTVRALSSSHAEVGLLDVEVGPSTARTIRVTGRIPTSELAVTGTVKACVAT